MNMRDMIPWARGSSLTRLDDQNPFVSLQREINRMFDDAMRGFNVPASLASFSPFGGGFPKLEVTDQDKELKVVAEVPGLEEKDIEVLLDDGALTIRGERTSETNDKDRQFSERYYGRFERRIPIDAEIVRDKVAADFKNGVLTITLPKAEQAPSKSTKIPISAKS